MKLISEKISVGMTERLTRHLGGKRNYFQLTVEIDTGDENPWQGAGRFYLEHTTDKEIEPGDISDAVLVQLRSATRSAFLYHAGEKVFAGWNLKERIAK